MTIAALALGMIGLGLSLAPLLFWAAIPLSVAALGLAWAARRRAVSQGRSRRTSEVALGLGSLALAVGLAMYALVTLSYLGVRHELRRLPAVPHASSPDVPSP